MRRVKCRDCGRQYDFDKDDFCPKCGSFNPPSNGGSTQIERELLARFGGGRQTPPNQARAATAARPAPPPVTGTVPRGRATPRSGQSAPAGADWRRNTPAAGRTPYVQPKGKGSSERNGRHPSPQKRGEEEVRNSLWKPLAIVLVTLVFVFAARFLWEARDTLFQRSPEIPDEPFQYTHAIGESFPIVGAQATIDDLWIVDLTSAPRAEEEGYFCLAVDVWIEGGQRQDGRPFTPPMLLLSSGDAVEAVDDPILSNRLSSCGVYDVVLSDCQWEDPLMGQFVFYVPAGCAGTQATLLLEEYVDGTQEDPALLAEHRIPLDLPGAADS